jgi:dipeptidase
MRQIYDWDSGRYLGEIPEAATTYNVVGNVNEWGLAIGETTFGGVDFGVQAGATLDYGSLIWVTLQRAKTARDAIQVLGDLMDTYGYASEGESFSIADAAEVWLMEIVGKGSAALGAVWVAVKVPDGYVSAHANQARITTFAWDDPNEALYAADVATFAVAQGLYPSDAPRDGFSFSDVYDPVTFEGARLCEARVWSFFGNVTSDAWAQEYLDYASGHNLTNRMPLWVQPSAKLDVAAVEHHMRNTYQGRV